MRNEKHVNIKKISLKFFYMDVNYYYFYMIFLSFQTLLWRHLLLDKKFNIIKHSYIIEKKIHSNKNVWNWNKNKSRIK